MRKKYLSALLFGALLFASAGTFTSCKDYDDDINNLQDDDINNLQEQIDAQKSLSEKLTAVESSINDLKAADADLQSKIDAATEAAEKAALEAQQNAVKEAAAQLETVKGELTAMISEQKEATDESIEAINTEIAKIQGSVQALEKLNGEIESLKTVDAALQTSISGLETKVAENARKIGELQTTLEAQEDALELFKAATGENVEALQGDIAVLQAKVAELAGSEDLRLVSEQLAALQDDFEALSDKVDAISADLNLLKNAWYTGVTSVSLVVTDNTPVQIVSLFSAKSLTTRTFGEGLANAIEFVKGTRTKLNAQVVVRVSPVTATLDKTNIKFINSLGDETLKDLVQVVDVNPYEKLLSRKVSESGLWVVTLQAKDDLITDEFETEFDNATTVAGFTEDTDCDAPDNSSSKLEKVLFAMKVVDSDNTRGVVSEYALQFGEKASKPQSEINFDIFVGTNKYCIKNLHNRYSMSEEDNTPTPKEYVWDANEAQTEEIYEGALTNVVVGDNRQNVNLMPVVEAKTESFTIRMANSGAAYYYITLDKDRAVTSDDSERLTWEQLYESSIENINTVFSVNETPEIKIGFNKAINDVLGFRVYAINADGTLQDPDGRAFYVRVGEEVANVVSASTSIIPDANITAKSADIENVDFSKFADIDTQIGKVFLTSDKSIFNETNEIKYPFDITIEFEDGTEVSTKNTQIYSKNDLELSGSAFNGMKLSEFAKIKNIYAEIRSYNGVNPTWNMYTDGATYTNTLSFADKNGVVIGAIKLSVTKTMPTSLPEGFGWKETQLTGDTYNCYVLPWTQWEADAAYQAYMHLDKVFNVDDKVSDPAQYLFTFRTNDPKNDKVVKGYAAGRNAQIQLNKADDEFKMIDGKTEYATVIEYNYGAISSKTDQDIKVSNLTAADPKEYKLIYHDMFAEEHYAIDWADADALKDLLKRGTKSGESIEEQAQKVKFGQVFDKFTTYKLNSDGSMSTTVENTSILAAVSAISGIDITYNKYLSKDHNFVKITEAKFITKSTNQVSEYFEVSFTNDSNARTMYLKPLQNATDGSPITGSIPSILRVKLVDSDYRSCSFNIEIETC